MRYQVPQFVDIEDKIFGPLTLKQALYVGGGAGLCFIIWTVLPSFIAIVLIVPTGAFFAGLAFWKPNSRPMIVAVENGFKFFLNKKLYTWKKTPVKPKEQVKKKAGEKQELYIPKLSDSKLRELTWSLDINQNLRDVENNGMDFKL